MKFLTYLALVLIVFSGCKDAEKETASKTSEPQPEIEVENDFTSSKIPSYDYDGFNSRYLQKNNDTTYVVNFWATWCKPCVKELPAFEQINSDYSDKKVKVVLVSLDFPDKLETHVVPFTEKMELQSEVVLLDDDDMNRWIPMVSEEWSGAIPATIIVKQGSRKFYERSFTYEEIENELLTML